MKSNIPHLFERKRSQLIAAAMSWVHAEFNIIWSNKCGHQTASRSTSLGTPSTNKYDLTCHFLQVLLWGSIYQHDICLFKNKIRLVLMKVADREVLLYPQQAPPLNLMMIWKKIFVAWSRILPTQHKLEKTGHSPPPTFISSSLMMIHDDDYDLISLWGQWWHSSPRSFQLGVIQVITED